MRPPATSFDVWPPVPVAGRFDLDGDSRIGSAGGSSATEAVLAVACDWCVDRALRPATVTTVAALMREAVSYGYRSGAQGVTMTIRWLDLDRMRIELAWHGSPAAAVTDLDEGLRTSAPIFDRLADRWGVKSTGASESCQWFDIDTRTSTDSAGLHREGRR